eukprot:CAMPEP_0176230422 /NCGR_PEP_ID=MMETSP0121_2-20121125/24290_1 /TAXON_ID=160619 /ORGANISM="Kryptoperidinium foliaceum, Strain CCMP 1326" /LENGTH=500 /DNA_ID=CAMNT_0017569763 /DNA_START=155 /DNA_END=1657 /DNA_ORIENTATION=+
MNKSGQSITKDYTLGEVIGEGDFGVVHIAECKQTGVTRQVKSVTKGNSDQADLVRELDVYSDLDHPHIAHLFNVYEDDEKVHLVYERCEGGDLMDAVQHASRQGLRETDVWHLASQWMYAVSYLHAKGIAHRDIRLRNLQLRQPLDNIATAQVKMVDFGMATRFEKGDARLRTVEGTALYIAPEVLIGVNPGSRVTYYTEKCDIWSCGVVCFVLLTNRFPFVGDNDAAILKAVLHSKPHFYKHEQRRVSEAGREYVLQLLSRAVDKRPSASEMKNMLTAVMEAAVKQQVVTPRNSTMATDSETAEPSQEELLNNLKAFRGRNRLEREARRLMARHINDSIFQDLIADFHKIDMEGKGVVSVEAFKEGLVSRGFHDTGFLTELLKEADADGSGDIDYNELLAVSIERAIAANREALYMEAFKAMDTDNDGTLNTAEIAQAMSALDKAGMDDGCNMLEAAALLRDADLDGDGKVSYSEFCALMDKSASHRPAQGEDPKGATA